MVVKYYFFMLRQCLICFFFFFFKQKTAYEILFMGDYSYISRRLLERHLLVGEALSTEELEERTETLGSVQMMRGVPSFRFQRDGDDGETTLLLWEDVVGRIIRPNLKCKNGIIHIVDKVIMKRRDVAVTSAMNGPYNNGMNLQPAPLVPFTALLLLMSTRS
eukprot:TRINITY_DN1979_c0_g1_i1.p1 TRINITY_DN1979_c0_g1~~TRINITY_DN1979_c0_g1_i1.p1  ORF type:complete len:162 (+),score=10.14 TRINITY_DN1979_c0_g1_i1:27-512(+)